MILNCCCRNILAEKYKIETRYISEQIAVEQDDNFVSNEVMHLAFCSLCNYPLILYKRYNKEKVLFKEFYSSKNAVKFLRNELIHKELFHKDNLIQKDDLTYGYPGIKKQSIKKLNGQFVDFFTSPVIVSNL